MSEMIYGRNPVRECLLAGRRRCFKLMLADRFEPAPILDEIQKLARKHNLPVERAQRKRLDTINPNHQGVALEATDYPYSELPEMLALAKERGEEPFLLALDHIEDPHNLGAMLRTAELVGVHGVILPNHRQTEVNATVIKASAGASEHLLISRVGNLAQSLLQIKKMGVWAIGIQHDKKAKPFHQADLKGAVVLVIGSEGAGMSRIVRDTCDLLVEIPMRGAIDSLNASVACALVLYETWRTRGFQA
jgi:23S rRNA (guanosine2251-2'-O)-methyltransferase